MCDAYGIVNFESANVHVKGMGEYRPVSAFSYLGRYRLIMKKHITKLSQSATKQSKNSWIKNIDNTNEPGERASR